MTDHRYDPGRSLAGAFGRESEAELERQVPAAREKAVWPRLAAELAARPRPLRRSLPRLTWALAAALALMMTLSGWLAVENRALRQRPATVTAAVPVAAAPLAGPRAVTAGELVARLSRIPPETPVLTAAEAEQLLRRDRPFVYALLRGPRLDAITRDGVTAGEALAVLRRLDADTPIRLGGAAAGRSS